MRNKYKYRDETIFNGGDDLGYYSNTLGYYSNTEDTDYYLYFLCERPYDYPDNNAFRYFDLINTLMRGFFKVHVKRGNLQYAP